MGSRETTLKTFRNKYNTNYSFSKEEKRQLFAAKVELLKMFYNVDVAVDGLKSWGKNLSFRRISLLKIGIAADKSGIYFSYIGSGDEFLWPIDQKKSPSLSFPSFPRHLNNLG